jgi:hypothetical protein
LPPNSTTQDRQSNITPTEAPIPERSESVAEYPTQLPTPDSPRATPQPALFTQWRNSGRAKDWRPLLNPYACRNFPPVAQKRGR